MITDLDIVENKILDFERSHNLLELWLRSLDVKDSTKQAYKYGALEFIKWVHERNISNVEKQDILSYKTYLIERLSARTTNLYLNAIKSLYRYLEENNVCKDIAKNVKLSKISKGFKRDCFTLEQIKQILNSIDKSTLKGIRDYTLVQFLIRTRLKSL